MQETPASAAGFDLLLVHGPPGRVRFGARCRARGVSLVNGDGMIPSTEKCCDDCSASAP